jgi:phosphate transport system protein
VRATVDELRRSYHDRIADLHGQTVAIIADAASSVGNVTVAFLEQDREVALKVAAIGSQGKSRVAAVESEVVDLLAQQAPVDRDLRVILAALRIAQIGELCLGLVAALADRVGSVDVLTPSLRDLMQQIGAWTERLLEEATQAWRVIDEHLAARVVDGAAECRVVQRRFLGELIGLREVPVEAAVDLGLVARAYERLTDHAMEIAGRVVFAATGAVP